MEENATWSRVPVPKSSPREFFEILKVMIVALAIVLPIRYYLVQPFLVRGASMEPEFENRDYLIVDEISYRFREPERGEAVIFRYPRDPKQFFIKRIVGLPGERVEIRDDLVTIYNSSHPQGFRLDEPYLVPPGRSTTPDLTAPIEPGHYFVLGDNREFSSDSRVWGTLRRDYIIGRAVWRAWPLGRWGAISDYAFPY